MPETLETVLAQIVSPPAGVVAVNYAIADYGTAHRRGERVTVAGPVPVGVDGRPSVAVRGDASAYYAGGADH